MVRVYIITDCWFSLQMKDYGIFVVTDVHARVCVYLFASIHLCVCVFLCVFVCARSRACVPICCNCGIALLDLLGFTVFSKFVLHGGVSWKVPTSVIVGKFLLNLFCELQILTEF